MQKISISILFCCFILCCANAFAQDLKTKVTNNKELDSLRKKEEGGTDSVVFSSKYIRYTTHKLTKDSIQTLPIDTGLTGIQNFSVLAQPRRPTVGTGVMGLAATSLLFEPSKTIGFDAGFHALDFYILNHEDVKFYQARTPFTSLYYVNGSDKEQVLKITHSQNIKRNWNFGANFNRIGANGFYTHQRGDDLNAAIFTWYQSPNKRYNLWLDGVFNTLKAQENGSIVKENIFTETGTRLVDKQAESVRLNSAKQLWRKNSFMLKQSYFVGRIDSTGKSSTQSILPTNKITYTLTYTNNSYSFKKDEADDFKVLPKGIVDAVFTNDSTSVKHIQNEFIYSFFLRAKGNSIIKNELKIDAGIRHDFYKYAQYRILRDKTNYSKYPNSFQNISLLGNLGYRFSNRVDFNLDVQQIFQGENTGDFLYEAKSNLLLSKTAGRIVLGAYLQNKSPEEIYNRYEGNHYSWDKNFDRTKTANLSFNYINERFNIDASAAYYLVSNYLYFIKSGTNSIEPTQETGDINMLKLSLGKRFTYKTYHLDAYVAYQKTDSKNILRTPEVYTFNSIYKEQTFFKRLKTQIGFDIRYNTPFVASSYSPAASQFYNGDNLTFGSKPVVDIWVKAGLRRANLFLKYDYVNQGLFSNGFYTVNRYPMPDRLLKFGVSWNFYD
ncbi:putative porin [Pedobacter boryungensis]|uniref:Porin n=1 Tax=Pedobacter boryungensis TaxID=869962 RepID=A0ABX2DDQ6_9SPHI|nr:putative porin [Pedobacter boryungensis]NQX32219.1 putative porin [Pedobacter boryungensis]